MRACVVCVQQVYMAYRVLYMAMVVEGRWKECYTTHPWHAGRVDGSRRVSGDALQQESMAYWVCT